jgi:uncharacterized protein (TIGR03437 family)
MRFRIPTLVLFLGSNLFSGTALIKSTDGGRTWVDIDPGLPYEGIVELEIAPDGSRLYALTKEPRTIVSGSISWRAVDCSVLYSSDAARTWRELEPLRVTAASYASLAIAPSDSRTIFLAYGTPEDWSQPSFALRRTSFVLRRSTDGGRTAEMFRMSDADLLGPSERNGLLWIRTGPLAVHPTMSATLFLSTMWTIDFDATYSGTLSSQDGGSAWQFSRQVGLTDVQAAPADPFTLYARHTDPSKDFDAPERYVAKSTDGGKQWTLKLPNVASFALDAGNSRALIAGRNDGSLWKSADGAETWDQLGTFLPFGPMGIDFGLGKSRMTIYPSKPSWIVAQSPILPGGIFKIPDDGSAGSVTPTGMEGFTFVFDPSDANTVYGISEKRLEPRLRPPYIRNLAGGSALAPGSLFSIYGEDLGGEVTFNGKPAKILFASRRQIDGQVPADLESGATVAEVVRQSPDGDSYVDRQSVKLSWSAPVILHDSSGAPRIYHSGEELKITVAAPANPGERIVVYCTGLNQAETPVVQFWPNDRSAAFYPTLSAEPVANEPGVYRATLEVPRSLSTASYLLLFWEGQNFGRIEVR